MRRQTLYLTVLTAFALAVVVFAATAAGDSGKGKGGRDGGGQLISESSMLAGLSAQALFPFIDTTPHRVTKAHIAVTDATTNCGGPAATAPSNIQVLVGQAGVALVNVMTASTNTGIGTPAQCVFHVTVRPRRGGVPATVTDIVVRNAGAAPLTGINTVTASATVKIRGGDD